MKDKVEEEVRRDRDGEFQVPVIGTHWQGEAVMLGVSPANPGPGLSDEFSLAGADKTAANIDTASKSIKSNQGNPAGKTASTAAKSVGSVAKKTAKPAHK